MKHPSARPLVKSKRDNKTIEQIVDTGLCTRCGVCDPVCPLNSIKFDENFFPRVDWSTCTNCELCVKFCPGLSFDFKKYYQKLYGLDKPVNTIEGYFKKAYIGCSNKSKIREAGSSGGLVTHILVYLLRKKIVDAVILASDNKDDPVSPIPKIARTEDEIIAGAGSKYSVVPVDKVLKEVRKTHEKIAFVGVACQIHGLRRLEELDKRFSRNVKCVIGLACNATLESDAIKNILSRKGLTKSQVKQIKYRSGAFPGKLTATLRNGDSVQLMKHGITDAYGRLRLMYSPRRCHLCPDFSSEFADISTADIMLRKNNGEYLFPDGRTVILCRTDVGLKVMEDILKDDMVSMSPLSTELAKKNFKKMFMLKKIIPYYMIHKLKKKNRPHPQYNIEGHAPALQHILYEIIRTPVFRFFSLPKVRKIGTAIMFSKYGEKLTELKIFWKRFKAGRYKNRISSV